MNTPYAANNAAKLMEEFSIRILGAAYYIWKRFHFPSMGSYVAFILCKISYRFYADFVHRNSTFAKCIAIVINESRIILIKYYDSDFTEELLQTALASIYVMVLKDFVAGKRESDKFHSCLYHEAFCHLDKFENRTIDTYLDYLIDKNDPLTPFDKVCIILEINSIPKIVKTDLFAQKSLKFAY